MKMVDFQIPTGHLGGSQKETSHPDPGGVSEVRSDLLWRKIVGVTKLGPNSRREFNKEVN